MEASAILVQIFARHHEAVEMALQFAVLRDGDRHRLTQMRQQIHLAERRDDVDQDGEGRAQSLLRLEPAQKDLFPADVDRKARLTFQPLSSPARTGARTGPGDREAAAVASRTPVPKSVRSSRPDNVPYQGFENITHLGDVQTHAKLQELPKN